MAWGTKNTIINAQSVSGTEVFSSAVGLNPGEVAHVQVEADFPATPTDNLIVKIYGTLDDTSENWDDTPLFQQEIDNGIDPNAISLVIAGVYKFRLGVIRDGSTDTITVNAYERRDGVSL